MTYDTRNVGGSPENHTVMIFFRVASDVPNDISGYNTLYVLEVWDPGQPYSGGYCAEYDTPMPKGWVQILKWVNGEAILAAEGCSSNTSVGTNRASVAMTGDLVEVTVNGRSVLTWTDPDPILYGGVGLGRIWETNGWFDNVIVRAEVNHS